ncbi:hypothetical protein ACTL32_10280 [Planococcus sp. FY231025]|uniref:hypothetical protein n=1 Tax=Planococcus sp. FY231025 TaxID=3455699 RepID=UPI003F912FCC
MNFEKRSELHDSTLQYLVNNSYNNFRAPLYPMDQELQPLREVIKNYSNSSIEEYNLVWNAALATNTFYQELYRRFTPQIHHAEFIKKAGDVILDINDMWHIIELKTTTNAEEIYCINFDSFRVYDSLPMNVRDFIHILFYNAVTQSFWIARYNDLKFQSTCYVYPEVDPQRYNFIRSYSRFYDIKTNDNPNVSSYIDKTQNAYFKIDLRKQASGVLSPISEHIQKIRHNTIITH